MFGRNVGLRYLPCFAAVIMLLQTSTAIDIVDSNFTNLLPTAAPRIQMKSIGAELKCTEDQFKPSPVIPTNVNKVRPADIKAIGALGDSISVSEKLRRVHVITKTKLIPNSFATGGDQPLEQHITLANVLRKFSPTLRGLSYGTGMGNVGFNVGYSGNTSRNLTQQANTLVRKMLNNGVDIENEWKLVTLFIGTNDVGDILCLKKPTVPIDEYKTNIEKALQILKTSLPRTIVSIFAMWPPELVIEAKREIQPDPSYYKCVSDNATMVKLNTLCDGYRKAVYEIQNERKFNDETFTVVVQGFADEYNHAFRNSSGKYDGSFYAWDTFHLSKYGNGIVARELWNSLLQPVGKKNRNADLGNDTTQIRCPTQQSPFLYTIDNSS